jgi:hypothetical protein
MKSFNPLNHDRTWSSILGLIGRYAVISALLLWRRLERQNELILGSNVMKNLPDRSRKVAGEGEAVGSQIHPVVEVGRSSEVCKHISIVTAEGRASNPTGSSLAGVGTAVVVDLHILRGIQIQDSLTFLLADVYREEERKIL